MTANSNSPLPRCLCQTKTLFWNEEPKKKNLETYKRINIFTPEISKGLFQFFNFLCIGIIDQGLPATTGKVCDGAFVECVDECVVGNFDFSFAEDVRLVGVFGQRRVLQESSLECVIYSIVRLTRWASWRSLKDHAFAGAVRSCEAVTRRSSYSPGSK